MDTHAENEARLILLEKELIATKKTAIQLERDLREARENIEALELTVKQQKHVLEERAGRIA